MAKRRCVYLDFKVRLVAEPQYLIKVYFRYGKRARRIILKRLIVRILGHLGRATPYFPGKQRILESFVNRNWSIKANVYGFPMTLALSDVIQRHLFFGYYERDELNLLASHLHRGDTFVDVGANVGAFSACAASLVGPQGRVLTVEPTPALLTKLQATFGQNVPQVEILPIALGDTDGTLTLFEPPASLGNFDPSVIEYCANMKRFEVPVRRLKNVLVERAIKRVDFLKIDVEGFEPEVLDGMGEFLSDGRISAILIELNEPMLTKRGSSTEKLHQSLVDCGFKLDQVLGNSSDYRNALYFHPLAPRYSSQ